MKTTKLVIGIISIVLSIFVLFQSMFAGLGNALAENGEVSGSAGFIVAIFMIVAGIIAIVTRKGGKGGYVASGFYILAAVLGFSNAGSYSDLNVWSGLCLIFAVIFIIGGIVTKNKKKKTGAI